MFSKKVARIKVTTSIYIANRQLFICGREDGSIVLLSGMDTIKAHLFQELQHGKLSQFFNTMLPLTFRSIGFSQDKVLQAHYGRVTCLLYPNQHHTRYDPSYLVSGSSDFSVCLWDINSESLLQKFNLQSGEITQILVPPPTSSVLSFKLCSTLSLIWMLDFQPRIQHCICSVAKDHSVCLISLKERKCVLLASRHLFPVACIKWRPMDDFMMVSCTDGTLYVWQMETGI